MRHSDYWRQRFENLEGSLNNVGQETYLQVEPAFDDALREFDGQIEKWMNRIAKNNKLSMADARKLLDADQLAEFHWSVEEYIKYGQQNAIDQRWMKQLENASAKFHISKLEAMKIETQQALEKSFGNYLDGVDDMARKVYTEGYYRTAFEVQRGFGVGWDIASIDDDKLSKLISKPWAADGKNFSDRIWQAKTQMVNDLHNQMVRTCIMGEAPDKAIETMMKYAKTGVKNAKSQAARLIMTEQAFFSSAAQQDAFKELGVEEYEIVATLDSRTSETCQELDGKHFPMKDFEPGVTAPPFHVWCRTTTCPYFDDEFTADEMRAARGEDGKTYYVPANMKYGEWKNKEVGDFRNMARNLASFQTFDIKKLTSKTSISEEDIRNEMQNSPIGNEVLRQIDESDVIIHVLQGVTPPKGQRGDQSNNIINIYLDCIPNVLVAAQTLIHEMTHFYYKIGQCQWAEAVCFAKEKMHLEGRNQLTMAEKRYIVKLAKENYPEFNWRKGGHKNGHKL